MTTTPTCIRIDDTIIGLPDLKETAIMLRFSAAPPELVVIDNLQFLAPDLNGGAQTESVIRCIEVIAATLGTAVILTTGLPLEGGDTEAPPQLENLPYGIITGGADLVLGVYTGNYLDPDHMYEGEARIAVLRNRYGNRDGCTVRFDSACGLFHGGKA